MHPGLFTFWAIGEHFVFAVNKGNQKDPKNQQAMEMILEFSQTGAARMNLFLVMHCASWNPVEPYPKKASNQPSLRQLKINPAKKKHDPFPSC